MSARRFEWSTPAAVAAAIRAWAAAEAEPVDVNEIERAVRERGDDALLELTARYDATETPPQGLRVDPADAEKALRDAEPDLREALAAAAANIRAVAEAQPAEDRRVELPQGHTVEVLEVPVGAAGVYAPGGRAAYPSSVLMACIPARVAGVDRIALCSPPGADGELNPAVLAAAALCGVEEIYAVGGAQAVFALARGTESIRPVDVIAGPGSAWVVAAKRAVYGEVGVDTLAGPSELMIVGGHDTRVAWAALDLRAQAEHGPDSPLVLAAVEEAWLEEVGSAVGETASPLALVHVPDLADAIALANDLAPEHLQLMSSDALALAPHVRTAGCVFLGQLAGTAFGDYAAGSNHVLPTGGAGRFSGPLGPGTFRRRISNVTLTAASAAALAPHVDALARAEGFPVHGESARSRS
ncbi:MAG TPA: histidinol dehydrogenase [Solirubrobacterales bacterium]|nr:histidinol dehydrogenase [Solirubrobacterales bacterium]